MKNKMTKLFGIPTAFLCLGILFLIFGANGEGMAIMLSRPAGASSWTTSSGSIDAFRFIPLILGASFLVLFISTFSISFYKWQKNR
ncbi:hypothetical protein [Planococcus antarcticus]|uniref:hypothetical protein n=1 Tax=Planococcus antarcticus TaxID=161360 RepID=UPI00030B06DC|nr:hypothetical protein [Planococcus antarcticus]